MSRYPRLPLNKQTDVQLAKNANGPPPASLHGLSSSSLSYTTTSSLANSHVAVVSCRIYFWILRFSTGFQSLCRSRSRLSLIDVLLSSPRLFINGGGYSLTPCAITIKKIDSAAALPPPCHSFHWVQMPPPWVP